MSLQAERAALHPSGDRFTHGDGHLLRDHLPPTVLIISFGGMTADLFDDDFLVPYGNTYRTEFIGAEDERLSWLTGFSGSAGVAIIMLDRADLFVDGRYTEQAMNEVDPGVVHIHSPHWNPPPQWIRETLVKGTRLGYDPWLHPAGRAPVGRLR